MKRITLNVNGIDYKVTIEPYASLLGVLRTKLGFTGPKKSCDTGGCGTCTVIINGRTVYSCMYPAMKAQGKKIVTVEGLKKDGQLDKLQEAFIENAAIQCGYCTPGMLMSAKALLDSNPNPTEEDIRKGLSGNLCRCTGYINIIQAVKEASVKM